LVWDCNFVGFFWKSTQTPSTYTVTDYHLDTNLQNTSGTCISGHIFQNVNMQDNAFVTTSVR
jgi:hypothetical protein